jgi:hypothetical protein
VPALGQMCSNTSVLASTNASHSPGLAPTKCALTRIRRTALAESVNAFMQLNLVSKTFIDLIIKNIHKIPFYCNFKNNTENLS